MLSPPPAQGRAGSSSPGLLLLLWVGFQSRGEIPEETCLL